MTQILRTLQPELAQPHELEALSVLYRSAVQSRRALLVLDDVAGADQVQALLPAAGSFVIITSRFGFILPGLMFQAVDILSRAEAQALLVAIAPQVPPELADEIVELCGALPFAIRIAASMLASRRDLSPAEYTRRLRDEPGTRGELATRVLGVSYELLDESHQALWRALVVFPHDFDREAVAAVWDTDLQNADNRLAELAEFSLVQSDPESSRYQLHPLARVFLDARVQDDERLMARRRHAHHYAEVLSEANRLYLQGGVDQTAGLALLDRERPNVEAGLRWAADLRKSDKDAAALCSRYVDLGAYLLPLRQSPREQIEWLEAAIESDEQVGDQTALLTHTARLAICYASLNDFERAEGLFREQLEQAQTLGDRVNEVAALGNIGLAAMNLGKLDDAVQFLERQLAFDDLDQRSRGVALGNLGAAFTLARRLDEAVRTFEEALALRRATGDRVGEAVVLSNLANLRLQMGSVEEGLRLYDQALALHKELGDRRGEVTALWNSAQTRYRLGQFADALERGEAALAIFRELNDPFAPTVEATLAEWRRSADQAQP